MLLFQIDVSILNMISTHNTTRKNVYYNGKNSCNNYKVVAIRCYCNNKKVVVIRHNKLHGNRFIQPKNLIAINPNIENCVVKELISFRKLRKPFKIKFNVDVRLVLN